MTGLLLSPRLMPHPSGVLNPRKTVSAVCEYDTAQGSSQLSLQLIPQSHKSQSHTTLACSALPVQEPKGSGCEQNFVCFLFKRVAVISSRLQSLSHGQRPCCFSQPDVMWLCCSGLGSLAWGLDLMPLRGNPTPTAEKPVGGAGPALLTSLDVAFSVNPWL